LAFCSTVILPAQETAPLLSVLAEVATWEVSPSVYTPTKL